MKTSYGLVSRRVDFTVHWDIDNVQRFKKAREHTARQYA